MFYVLIVIVSIVYSSLYIYSIVYVILYMYILQYRYYKQPKEIKNIIMSTFTKV
jgi:hypothetical protein